MTKKKTPAAAAAPNHACGHEIWVHSKRNNGDAWRCAECPCKTDTIPSAS